MVLVFAAVAERKMGMKWGAWAIAVVWGGGFALAVPAGTAWGATPASGIAILGPSGAVTVLTPARLAGLPVVTETVSFGTDHGESTATYSGPLLWAVLQAGGAVGGDMPKAAVREYAVVTGADGYRAVVALGEVSPAFENKEVILATRVNGEALGPGHDRLVVPGERRGGRSVRDVVRIAVAQAVLAGN